MANASVEIAESLDIYCRKDDTFNLVLTVQNADTSNFDFTSYSATLNVKKHPSSDTNILSFSSGAGLTLATGSITLAKTAAQMDLEAGVYYYELNVTDASSNVNAWLTGDFIINSDKTNDITSSSTLTVDTTGSAVTLTISGIAGIAAGSDTELQYNNNGVFGGVSELTYNDSTGLLSYQPTLDEATGNEIALNLSYTVNKATSGNDTGLLINQTDTASPGTSYLLDLQVGGSTKFVVNNIGTLTISGSIISSSSTSFRLNSETSSSTNPTLIPHRSDVNSGIGGDSGEVSIINNSIETLTGDASNNVTIPNGKLLVTDGTASTPSIAPSSDTDSGLYFGTAQVNFTLAGAAKYLMTTTAFRPVGNSALDLGTSIVNWKSFYLGGDLYLTDTSAIQVNSVDTITFDASQNVTIPNGDLTVSADTDATTILGRARIDSRTTDYAVISHYDQSGVGDGKLEFLSNGHVRLNAAISREIRFSINNGNQWVIDAIGNLDAQANQNINLGSGSAIQVASIDTITFDASQNVTIPNGDLSIGDSAGLDFTYGRIYFGDGDTGVYEVSDDIIQFKTAGLDYWRLSANSFQCVQAVGAPEISRTNGYTFFGDSNTYLKWNSADDISLFTGGVEGLNIDSSQNVSIPNGDLEVTNTITGTNDLNLNAATSSSIRLKINGSNKGTLNTSGFVLSSGMDFTINAGDLTISSGIAYLTSYTVAGLPSATTAGGFIYVSDETGGATMAFSDGTNWRRVQDRAIVS